MNEDHSPSRDTERISSRSQGKPRWVYPEKPAAEDETRTMSILEAERELGLTDYHIYRAVKRREIHCIRVTGKGHRVYLEDELKALAERLGKCPYTWAGAA